MTKSAMATPGRVDLAVRTVKMEGSCETITSQEIWGGFVSVKGLLGLRALLINLVCIYIFLNV